jgi:hypothetical protein
LRIFPIAIKFGVDPMIYFGSSNDKINKMEQKKNGEQIQDGRQA